MKYIIDRASLSDDKIPPCEGAEITPIHRLWKREFKLNEGILMDALILEEWQLIKEEKGQYIYLSKKESKVWTVDIEDLNAFVDKYGDIIIFSETSNQEGLRSITIYDSSIE